MFRKFMLFGFGGLAIAATLAFSPGVSTSASHEPALDRSGWRSGRTRTLASA
jgi:hypothetical protein